MSNVDCSDKVLKLLPTGFTDTVQSAKEEEIKKIVFQAQANVYAIAAEQNDDAKLTAAKELVKDLSGPYKDAKACQNAKIQYALWVLESRGIELNSLDDED